HPAAHPAGFARQTPDPARLPVPCPVSVGASGPHHLRMGRVREQAQGEVLPVDEGWEPSTSARSCVLATNVRSNRLRTGGGIGGHMSVLARLQSFLAALLFRRRMERDMVDEFRFHLHARTEDLIAAGIPRAEAETRALREFGDQGRWKEWGREARGLRVLD